MKYRILPHTTDIRLKIYGQNLKELFLNSTLGLVELLGIGLNQTAGRKRIVRLKARDAESLLVDWLNEILYIIQTKHFRPASIVITHCNGKKLEAALTGKYSKGEIPLLREIKAATYHNLEIRKKGKLFETEVLFDL